MRTISILARRRCHAIDPSALVHLIPGFGYPIVRAAAPATTQSSFAELDRAVLETVFADLFTAKDSPVAMRGKPPESIRVAEEAVTWPITVEKVLTQHDKKLWEVVSDADLAAAHEAAWHLVQRHEKKELFAPFTSRDPRVQRVSTTQPTTASTKPSPRPRELVEVYNRPIRSWSPGYTADRRFAVVQLSIPWSMHHADGTYLLRWDEAASKWVVVLRQFIYYV